MASYLLAVHPETQEKLYQEIISVFAKLSAEAGPDGPVSPIELVTNETLSRFDYLNGVLSETLRIYAPGSNVERQASKDILLQTEDGRVKINVKKDDIVHFFTYAMHRDPEQFPEPEKFRPERFIGSPTHHKYAYMPFGAGPRNCVARSLALMEAKLAILHTIRQFRLSVAPETIIPPEFVHQSQMFIPKDTFLKVK